jgi:hypothetical protein
LAGEVKLVAATQSEASAAAVEFTHQCEVLAATASDQELDRERMVLVGELLQILRNNSG